ncbi:hypothetical protein CDD82_4868 [Ophiocordyceps australis]|uniref:Uncharacterized protein n=1 Tax=Ophiocordyceps australis TaxID=1399860 RepID=A0A2C5Z0U6_9HYPO|nr:hypothetical protein CDD82_4868 [Ophiocordyceps australis]
MLIQHLLSLGLASLAMAADVIYDRPCGLKIAPCPRNQQCVPESLGCTDLNVCRGTCVTLRDYGSCGGRRPDAPKCRDGASCKDDPRIPGNCGMACDRPGICIPDNAPKCAGFGGLACPRGLRCYDFPNDGCDPAHGGADCIGVCL